MAYTTINKSTDYFNTKLYTGNGSTQSITGVGFQPDWTWTKGRSGSYGVSNHKVYDVVRGATKTLFVNLTNAETTQTNTLTSFDSDGFSLGNDTNVNGSSTEFVSWNWYTGATASSNTDGSITSSVSANTTAGFSIVSYTGTGANATVGHGLLSSAPKVIIIKGLSTTYDWVYGGDNIGWTKYLNLNNTSVGGTASVVWNDTAPTSSVFSLGSNVAVNQSSVTQIAYCFAEKKGYSKFGSYTGNNSNDGTFVYTGFKPAWVMVKRTDSNLVANWSMFDNKRSSYNIERSQLEANTSDAQQTDASADIDLLSNGFKLRSTADENNDGGGNYIFMAFAEAPLVGTNNVPCTAR